LRGHLLKDDEDEEEDAAALVERVFAYFAERKGGSDYHPTVKEQVALEKLLADGFTFEQITAGIDAAFARLSRPKYFTHCAAIARDLVRLQQESRMPETRSNRRPESTEALETTDQQPETAYACRSHRNPPAPSKCTAAPGERSPATCWRFRLMASRCDQAARRRRYRRRPLADALTSAGRCPAEQPAQLRRCRAERLDRQRTQRKAHQTGNQIQTPRRETPAAGREPAAHAGIREYLENMEHSQWRQRLKPAS
jgi:hypothetical protein